MHGLRESLPGRLVNLAMLEHVSPDYGDDKRLMIDRRQRVDGRNVRARRRPVMLGRSLREEIGERESERVQYCVHVAAAEVVQQYTAVVEFANGQRRRSVVVRRTPCNPSTWPGGLHAVEPVDEPRGVHRNHSWDSFNGLQAVARSSADNCDRGRADEAQCRVSVPFSGKV